MAFSFGGPCREPQGSPVSERRYANPHGLPPPISRGGRNKTCSDWRPIRAETPAAASVGAASKTPVADSLEFVDALAKSDCAYIRGIAELGIMAAKHADASGEERYFSNAAQEAFSAISYLATMLEESIESEAAKHGCDSGPFRR
jgi:hypothetical protein